MECEAWARVSVEGRGFRVVFGLVYVDEDQEIWATLGDLVVREWRRFELLAAGDMRHPRKLLDRVVRRRAAMTLSADNEAMLEKVIEKVAAVVETFLWDVLSETE